MAGLYLGDVARRVLLTLAQEVQLFGAQVRSCCRRRGWLLVLVGLW